MELKDASLSLDIMDKVLLESSGLWVHGRGCKSLVWNPLARSSWGSLLQHAINLFQRKTLGLWNEEISIDESSGTETSPNEKDARFKVALVCVDHVWSDNGNDSVPEPIRRSRKSHTTRSDRKCENFADNNPGTRTPSRGKEKDEDTDEGNLSVDSGDVVGSELLRSSTD